MQWWFGDSKVMVLHGKWAWEKCHYFYHRGGKERVEVMLCMSQNHQNLVHCKYWLQCSHNPTHCKDLITTLIVHFQIILSISFRDVTPVQSFTTTTNAIFEKTKSHFQQPTSIFRVFTKIIVTMLSRPIVKNPNILTTNVANRCCRHTNFLNLNVFANLQTFFL